MDKRCGIAAAAVLLPLGSVAATLCVSDTNNLAAALVQAQSTSEEIQLVKGTYRLDQTPWSNGGAFARSGTSLTGGYAPGCASRDIDPASTVLGDDGASHDYAVFPYGDLTLDTLKFNTREGLRVYAGSSTLDATVTVRHAIFAGPGTGPSPRLGVIWDGGGGTSGTVRVVDSLFHGSATSWCGLGIQDDVGNVDVYLINNTAGNNGYGICLYDDTAQQRASFHLYNNIAYGNSDDDLISNTNFATLVDNTYSSANIPAGGLIPTPVGTKTADPQLNSNYVPIAPGSPAIDTGTQIVPGGLPATDIAGNPRVVGADVDRGAYESSYDSSTVQQVTSTADSGAGSLRAAIHNANLTAGRNTITFAIGSDCSTVKVIRIDSNLEAISGDTSIKGFTQPGASRNTLDIGNDANVCVALEPSASSTATDGLRVLSGAADGVNLTVEGLGIGGFAQDGISLLGGSSHNINGNHFGGSVGGHALAANGVAVRIGAGVHDVTVGGADAGQRNLIGGATNAGVFVAGTATPAHDNQIVNNYIGIGWSSGFTNRGNGTNGIYLAGASNTVSDNLIGNNGNDGVDVDNTAASGNSVTHNSIGGTAQGAAFANGLAGVRVENGAGANTINANTITANTNAGVRIVSGYQNKIRRNSIFGNGGLGIDLAGAGVTPNDDDYNGGILPLLANRGLNFPENLAAAGGQSSGEVTGTLTTTSGDYTVDLYQQADCDASGNGEGRLWLGAFAVTVPGLHQGTGTFDARVTLSFPDSFIGSHITATATDSAGNTSEFSACAAYTDDTIFSDGFNGLPI